MANINPVQPTQGNILKKSPVLGMPNRVKREVKKPLDAVTKPNLMNVQKSITPTVRSKPYGEH